MLKLIRSIVTSSFQHPRIIKKLNHNCCKISLRSLIILTRESKGGKKKKKNLHAKRIKQILKPHTFKTWRESHPCLNLKNISLKIKLFPSIPFHTYFFHTLLTLWNQKIFNDSFPFQRLKDFTPKKNISPILPTPWEQLRKPNDFRYSPISRNRFSLPACMHACIALVHALFDFARVSWVERCCYVTSSSGCHTHPVLRRGTWETLQCQECGVKVVPFRTGAILKRPALVPPRLAMADHDWH